MTLSGSSVYRAEDSRGDDRGRDRSPIRSDDRCEATNYSQADAKKQKLTFGFGRKSGTEQKKGIQIKLGSTSVSNSRINGSSRTRTVFLELVRYSRSQKPTVKPTPVQRPTVASVFNADEDDEPEEMPAEARMRMRNIGRETPTSAGPNSFGKTKQGFCDSKKIFEKTLKKAMEEANK